MKLQEFRKLVKEEFGDNLKHATPANVREFVDRLENDDLVERVTSRIVISEPCSSYEEVIKDFFAQMLDQPPDEAIVALWTIALDLAFAAIETQASEQFATLFQDSE